MPICTGDHDWTDWEETGPNSRRRQCLRCLAIDETLHFATPAHYRRWWDAVTAHLETHRPVLTRYFPSDHR